MHPINDSNSQQAILGLVPVLGWRAGSRVVNKISEYYCSTTVLQYYKLQKHNKIGFIQDSQCQVGGQGPRCGGPCNEVRPLVCVAGGGDGEGDHDSRVVHVLRAAAMSGVLFDRGLTRV